MDTSRYLHELVTLWVVIDPIGTLPVFLAITAHMNATTARGVAVRGTLMAFAVLMFFVIFGQVLLSVMEIEMSSFQVAGNIVLFLFALTMIFGESKLEEEKQEEKEHLIARSAMERAVFPLAIPSIASPGAMLAAMTLTDNSHFNITEQAETVIQIAVILAILLGLLLLAPRIIAVIGIAGASVISRVMGLILASVAVDGLVKALREIMLTAP